MKTINQNIMPKRTYLLAVSLIFMFGCTPNQVELTQEVPVQEPAPTEIANNEPVQDVEPEKTSVSIHDFADYEITPPELTDTKTYTNDTYGFRFEMPQDWITEEMANQSFNMPNEEKTLLYLCVMPGEYAESEYRQGCEAITVTIYPNNDKLELISFLENKNLNHFLDIGQGNEEHYKTIIDNKLSILIKNEGGYGVYDITLVPIKDKVFEIRTSQHDELIPAFELILTTFTSVIN